MEFSLPSAIKDFVFDLYTASRVSLRLDDVTQAYEVKFKELTDKYFSQTAWPESEAISSECKNDQIFLLFYR
jgi:translation initiation factor 3 subunit L